MKIEYILIKQDTINFFVYFYSKSLAHTMSFNETFENETLLIKFKQWSFSHNMYLIKHHHFHKTIFSFNFTFLKLFIFYLNQIDKLIQSNTFFILTSKNFFPWNIII